jgi:ATP-binding cassette subfamily C (CFTR/MRP) protein 1
MKSKFYSYVLMIFTVFCVAEPLFRVIMGYSTVNLDGQSSLAPFEVLTLLIEAAAWSCVLVMLIAETKIYIREFRWYIRFMMIYVLIGEITVFKLVFAVRDYLSPTSLYLYITELACKFLFGILLLGHVPSLEAYAGYMPLRNGALSDDTAYEALASGENICPERHANIFSRIFFTWMTPLMQQGNKRPITEKDVWKLDTWDQTETLYTR